MNQTRKIADHNIIDIIGRDIQEMDADSLEALIEFMYSVKATYDPMTELIEITVDASQNIEEIFGEKNIILFENE